MLQHDTQTRRRLVLVVTIVAALAAGCHEDGHICSTDKCADIPPGAIPQPAGVYNCRWTNEQAARAEQDKFVIHQMEWFSGGDQLGPDGRRHIEQIAKRWGEVPYPIIVSASDDSSLNTKRQQIIVETLTRLGVDDADRRVKVGYPEAEGLYGTEAVRYGNIRLGGNTTGTSGAFGTGSTTGYGGTSSGFGVGTTSGAGTGFGGGMGVY